jgi:hypothetical protein
VNILEIKSVNILVILQIAGSRTQLSRPIKGII